jgi:hypothetical protein
MIPSHLFYDFFVVFDEDLLEFFNSLNQLVELILVVEDLLNILAYIVYKAGFVTILFPVANYDKVKNTFCFFD